MKQQDVEVASNFCKDFFEILSQKATNKRLIRLIRDKAVCFGPKRKGPNLLINKFIRREESFFQKIKAIVHDQLGLDILV